MATLGTAEAKSGSVDTGRLYIGESRDGSQIGLPVCMINGASGGDTLYIQAVSDGDELNGVGVIRNLVPRLDPSKLSGTILIVGIVNVPGFWIGSHRNPIDDTKVNRTYPGNSDGYSSERLAAATFEVAKKADYVLDLHQASTNRMVNEVRVRCGSHHRLRSECLELAKAFNYEFIYDKKGPSGQLAQAAANNGIPAIDPELGGSVGLNEDSVRKGVRGIENVLKHYDFLDEDEDEKCRNQVVSTSFHSHTASVGGLVKFEVNLGDRVKKRDVIYYITDIFGRVKSEEISCKEGVFWRSCRLPHVATGEYVCSVGIGI